MELAIAIGILLRQIWIRERPQLRSWTTEGGRSREPGKLEAQPWRAEVSKSGHCIWGYEEGESKPVKKLGYRNEGDRFDGGVRPDGSENTGGK